MNSLVPFCRILKTCNSLQRGMRACGVTTSFPRQTQKRLAAGGFFPRGRFLIGRKTVSRLSNSQNTFLLEPTRPALFKCFCEKKKKQNGIQRNANST
jgi:hypothetical protein